MKDRVTALAEIGCGDAVSAYLAIIGANDVGERHADRCEEDFWPAFFLSTGCRNYIF